MTRSRQFIRSWSGGIISPELFGRLDDARYQQGADTIENFVCRMGGSLQRRPGWDFVRETKDSSKASRLIPFVYSTGQAVAMECGEEYFRFHTDGATLLYIVARKVSSVDTGTAESITFTQAHNLRRRRRSQQRRGADVRRFGCNHPGRLDGWHDLLRHPG